MASKTSKIIADLRKAKGWSQTELANNSSVSREMIGKYERGEAVPSIDAAKKIKVYNKTSGVSYAGKTNMLSKHISDDTSNTNFIPANRYNVWMPLIGFALNRDDGFQLGLGSQYIQQGFRKFPYASLNRLMMHYSFSTSAFKINYSGEWLSVFGKADIIANADIYAPENTHNFFGRGNESGILKVGDFRKYYRSRFNLYQFIEGK